MQLAQAAPRRHPWRVPIGRAVVLLLFFSGLTMLGLTQLNPPAAEKADVPATSFSAARAMTHVTAIAQQPHPVGSSEHDRVRDYLLATLHDLGFTVEIQRTTASGLDPRLPDPIAVQNVVGRRPGSANTRAVMLVAHYDTVAASPGAADDSAGVAAILEAMRAIRAGQPLRNDLIVLFTDGEELGMPGAVGFVEEHPWVADIGIVLNFEARGSRGPSLMFETSPGNLWLMREFAVAAYSPVASSWMADAYRLMPNNSDLTVFNQAGLAGLNFAFIDGWSAYHRAGDSVSALDPRSLQHHGGYALDLTQRFGNLDLNRAPTEDAVYFNLVGRWFVHYSQAWVLPLTIAVALLYVAVALLGVRRRQLRLTGMLQGALFFLIALTVVVAIPLLVAWALQVGQPERLLLIQTSQQHRSPYAIGTVLLAIAVTAAFMLRFLRRPTPHDWTMGVWLWWLILLVLTSLALPGASYLFVWPLLVGLLGLGLFFVFERRGGHAVGQMVLLASAVPALLLLAPLISLFVVALDVWLYPIVALFTALLIGFLAPAVMHQLAM